jgi:hypothetical protein
MRFTHPGLSEAMIAAHFEYVCALSGSQRLAYVPVVASGFVILTISFGASTLTFHNYSAEPILSSYIIHLITI